MGKNKSGKPYRFVEANGRAIQCIFAHIPGKRFSTGTFDRDEAVIWAEEFLRSDGGVPTKMPTLEEFAKDFFTRTDPDSLYARSKSLGREYGPDWQPNNQAKLDNYILPKFGSYLLSAITPCRIEAWMTSIKCIATGKPMANTTKSGINYTFGLVMRDAVRKGYIDTNPVFETIKPLYRPDKSRKRELTAWEEKTLFPSNVTERLKVWKTPQNAAIMSIMHDTGFRPNEVCAICMDNLYTTPGGMAVFTDKTINGKTRKPINKVKTSGKGAENRVGLLSKTTEEIIELHIASKRIEDGYLFLNQRKGFLAPADTWKISKEVFTEYGCEDLTQYDLRHNFATKHKGMMDEQILAVAMGHKNGVRDDYDHRDAQILIGQLERNRREIFDGLEKEDGRPVVIPFKKKA